MTDLLGEMPGREEVGARGEWAANSISLEQKRKEKQKKRKKAKRKGRGREGKS